MYLTFSAKKGENLQLLPDYIKKTLILTLPPETIEAPDFYDFCIESLKPYKKLNLDLDSFLNLKCQHISDESLILTLNTIVSKYTNIPISLKGNKFKSLEEYKSTPLHERLLKSENYDWKIESKTSIAPNILNIIEAQNIAKQLQELPPNLLKPHDFTALTEKIISSLNEKERENVTLKIYDSKWLKENNLNLINAVAAGSEDKSQFLIIEYLPEKGKAPIALIGKGVCYDSGGLNVKTGSYMSNMKFDMSGAASTLGTIYSLIKNNSTQNVIAIMPLVENLISTAAYKPDDVFISYSGKSVEIDNTDAEGRLILADALSYAAKNYKPTELISIATLTGAIGYALGNKYAGAFATEEKNWNSLFKASKQGGEFIWRMPLHSYYLKKLTNSRVADIKNSARAGGGGASRAAVFLKEFTDSIPYIHLDIANIAYSEGEGAEGKAPLIRTLYYYLYKK